MTMSMFAETIFKRSYAIDNHLTNPTETWEQCAKRVASFVVKNKSERDATEEAIRDFKFMPGGRYLYGSGRKLAQLYNCFLFRAEDSREGWADLLGDCVRALATGGGTGIYFGDIRPRGSRLSRTGGTASGPVPLADMVTAVARGVKDGGARRSALWGGLPWNHPDIEEFINAKNWPTVIRALKEQDFNFPAPLDMMNISVCLDDDFFKVVRDEKEVWDFYYRIVKSMCKTGEPGFSVDLGKNRNDKLRNPCTEIVSSENGDSCNLGSLNLSRIKDTHELETLTRLAVRFLYAGTTLSWSPSERIAQVREKNRRIGLGLMGVHEWCLQRKYPYGPNDELDRWLEIYEKVSDDEAAKVSNEMSGPYPVGRRGIAPTGTIAILAQTSTGMEPINCVAFKRRYLGKNGKWQMSYVIDPTADRLIKQGIKPEDIEDAQVLSQDVERRLQMQAFIQKHVDQAISSTINLPEYGEPGNNNVKRFAETLLRYLPDLRGVTVYPDGSRPGQPIVPVKYETAKKHEGVVYEENSESCIGGVCGI